MPAQHASHAPRLSAPSRGCELLRAAARARTWPLAVRGRPTRDAVATDLVRVSRFVQRLLSPPRRVGMDLSGVFAATEKALAAQDALRHARAGELFGRAVAAAQALRQPDCLLVALLQCWQGKALLTTAALLETTDEEMAVIWQTVFFSLLPAVRTVVKRRAAARTLEPSACRPYEADFLSWHILRRFLREGRPNSRENRLFAAEEARLVGHRVMLMAGFISIECMKVSCAAVEPARQHFGGATLHEHCAFVVRALKLALHDSMSCRWDPLHTSLLCRAKQLLTYDAETFPEIFEGLPAPDLHELRDAVRRLNDHAGHAYSQRLSNDMSSGRHALDKADAASLSAARRCCALASCGARELHVAHFKACAACKTVVYCCKEHQVADWSNHKAACKAARKPQAQAQEE